MVKKIKLSILPVIVFMCMLCSASAENISAPGLLTGGFMDSTSNIGFLLGIELDAVTDRNLKDMSDDAELFFTGLKMGVVIQKNAMIYAEIGQGEAELSYRDANTRIKMDTDKDIFWKLGFVYTVAEKAFDTGDILSIGINGWYRALNTDADEIRINNVLFDASDFDEAEIDYAEYQLGIGASYKYEYIIPYMGFKLSNVSGETTVKSTNLNGTMDLESESNIGFFAGVTFNLGGFATLNAETRLGDETSFSGNCVVRF